VVAAPAGFGKTTLLTEWLATLTPGEPRVAWLSLDHRDNDPSLFWTYVVTALGTAVDGVGSEALQVLASPSPSTEAALATVLNDLAGLPEELLLILDDYHLIEAPEVHDGIAFLLDHRPPQLHVVLATRTDPPLPLARMRARGQLSQLRAADLRFTVEESAAYLNGPMGLRLRKSDLAALDGRTEGWIAALQLAALSMQGRDDVTAFIAGFAGDDRFVVDHLGEEVLARQPDEVRDFLLKTSILERLTGPLCDAVTGRGGGKAALVALERANLFLVPLDDRRQWYRYHHLFGDVLQAHLLDEHAGDVAELHRRAGTWLEAHGDASRAIDHALAGGDFGRAAELMERAIPAMTRERREVELGRWVRALPEEVVQVRPVPGVTFVGVLARVSDFDTIGQRLSRIERSLCAPDGAWPGQPPPDLIVVDDDGYRSLSAHVAMYRAALALSGGDLEGTVSHARRALELATPDDDHARASAAALAGLASWTRGTWRAPTPRTPRRSQASPRPGSPPTSLAAASPSRTSGVPRAGSMTPCGPTSGPWSSIPPRPAPNPGEEPPTCTSGWRGCCWNAMTSQPPRTTSPSATPSVSTTGCRRTPTGGGWSWPGCAKPKVTSTAPSSSSTQPIACMSATTCRRCGRFPRFGPGSGFGAASCPTRTHRPRFFAGVASLPDGVG
jgi:LuxR family maltose regulon positive regulatory protein